jgi:tRNA(Ile)-lysidine synthase
MAAPSVSTLPRARKRVEPTQNALPDALVRRFADDVARLIGAGATGRIGIAVSGGADSLALLLLAQAACPLRIEAATVDHQLRPAAADEAVFVAELCAVRGIPHAILTIDALPDGNVSAAARTARYAALAAWADARGIDWIMTGHHADDQRETIIMRLNRGAGVGGLSGIRARNGRIIRPLLHWRHNALVAIVASAGIDAIDDPTNDDDAYDRARLRKMLCKADWIDSQALAISADALAEADIALDWATAQLVAAHVSEDDAGIAFDRCGADLPGELLRRLTLHCLRRIDPANEPRGISLARFIATLETGGAATLGSALARGGTVWHFARAPARRSTASQ